MIARRICASLLLMLFIISAAAPWIAPHPPEQQYRESTNAPPSPSFPLGTDDLGRDRLSRLLHAGRISMLLAPVAALVSVGVAALIGGLCAATSGLLDRVFMGAADLTLSVPWLMLLLTVRALLPLDVTPWISLLVTFALLAVVGWAAPARVIRASVAATLRSNYAMAARARGAGYWRVLLKHVLPGTRPILTAQFGSTVPVFILAEANLTVLGLGVVEPAASWGTLLKEVGMLATTSQPLLAQYWLLAPIGLVVVSVLCWNVVFPARLTT